MVKKQIEEGLRVEELVGSLKKAQMINTTAADHGLNKVPIHISLDCGNLGRDGFNVSTPKKVEKTLEAIHQIATLQHLDIVGISSHYSSPETDSNEALCQQATDFLDVSKKIIGMVSKYGHIPKIHMAASESAIRLPATIKNKFDYMRIGRILYGLLPHRMIAGAQILPVMSILCHKLAEHLRDEGSAIGYCRKYICDKSTIINTLSLGWSILSPEVLSHLQITDGSGAQYEVCGYGAMNPMNDSPPSDQDTLYLVAGRATKSITEAAKQADLVPPALTIMAGNNSRTGRLIIP